MDTNERVKNMIYFCSECGYLVQTNRGLVLRDGRTLCIPCFGKEPIYVRFEMVEWELRKLRDIIFKLLRIDKLVNWLSKKLKS